MALWSSIRFSLRILKKHWKLTSIAVLSLAIAMAAGTAGFSVFNALLLRPPVVLVPNHLLTVYSSTPTMLTAYSAARPWLRTDPMASVRHV